MDITLPRGMEIYMRQGYDYPVALISIPRLRPVVDVKEYLKKNNPFNLESRLGIAKVFQYFGWSWQVADFMQDCSNRTRAYFVNANRLKGFLIESNLHYELTKMIV